MNTKIKLPENFVHIVMKTLPEISEISAIDFVRTVNFAPTDMDLTLKPRFYINLKITIESQNKIKGSKDYYLNEIITIFKFAYNDIDFVNFDIKEFIIKPEPTNDQKFISLFGV